MRLSAPLACALLLVALPLLALAQCPFAGSGAPLSSSTYHTRAFDYSAVAAAAAAPAPLADFAAVKQDVLAMLRSNKDFFPADVAPGSGKGPYYGPLFVRQAWHCAGSYRISDGLGGCDGGRQRFEPERSWDDNTNLDKTKKLLWPIKQTYGAGLSWGDLIIFAANVAIEDMGGPVLGFCAGRTDDADGSDSVLLGPNDEQKKYVPCLPEQGNCSAPLGATTLGLIYVNPEGPQGNPDPMGSFPQIRDTFARMAMNDSETVALIGGGHAFGKTHGACVLANTTKFPRPSEDPVNPWPIGLCGAAPTGQSPRVVTSGFEGPWTQTPDQWSNKYFTNLLSGNWTKHPGPGGHWQWKDSTAGFGPLAGIMMLTSDVSLTYDTEYLKWVKKFAANTNKELETAFAHAWYKLTTRDMGPYERCAAAPGSGFALPPAQPFQNPLPSTGGRVTPSYDLTAVRARLVAALRPAAAPAGWVDVDAAGKPYAGAAFVELAYQCAATFRRSDYLGGCNGARVRLSTQANWTISVGLDLVLAQLAPIQSSFAAAGLSWADLIVFAGQVALEDASGGAAAFPPFCAGRTDAREGDAGSDNLQANLDDAATDAAGNGLNAVRRRAAATGLTTREWTALSARLRSPTLMRLRGYGATSWSTKGNAALSNAYFSTLLGNAWQVDKTQRNSQYSATTAAGATVYATPADHNLIEAGQDDYTLVAQEYTYDQATFYGDFVAAWTKLMNADRFAGPSGNLCAAGAGAAGDAGSTPLLSRPWFVAAVSVVATASVAAAAFWCFGRGASGKKTPLLDSDTGSVRLL